MVTSTLQTTLPYPPEQVWQVVTDLTDTAWRSDIARVERTGPGAFVEYTPAGVATRFTVTAQEPCRRWAFVKGYLKGQQARYAGDLRRALETRFG